MAARGLWIEMLCIMHEATPYGHLLHKGKILDASSLAVLVSAPVSDVASWLAELEEFGVVERKRNGVLFSKRMESDEIKRSKNRENGKKGGNPSLRKDEEKKASDNPQVLGGDKAQRPETRDQRPEEISSLRSDSSSGIEIGLFDVEALSQSKGDEAQSAFDAYNALASELGLKVARKLDPARRKKIAATLKLHGADGWSEALDRIRRSRFLRGEASDFSASLNFMLQPSSFTKIIEGEYEKDRTNGNGTHHGEPAWKAQRVEDYSEFGAAGIAALGLRNGRSGGG
tara:strand:+ start:886 stop:1743 length:858 start_codon:yes stop_codon:yes gene_type:complete